MTEDRGLPPVEPQPSKQSKPPRKPKESKKIAIIAIIAFVLPVSVFTIFSVHIIQVDTQNHQHDADRLTQLEAQIKLQNNTVNNLANFLVNQQLPFDSALARTNTTIHERLDALDHKGK